MSDLAVVLIPVLAAVVGAVAAVPWVRWSKRRKAHHDSQNIVVLLDWVDRLSTEQRMEHGIYNSAHGRPRKRERVVIH